MRRLLFHTKLKFYLLVLCYSEPNKRFSIVPSPPKKDARSHVKLSRSNLCTKYSQ